MLPPAAVTVARSAIPTGVDALDGALAGGLPAGTVLLLSGEVGAGATELAFSALRRASRDGRVSRFASALRSPARVLAEAEALFPGEEVVEDLRAIGTGSDRGLVDGLQSGGLLVLESASALARAGEPEFVNLVERACDHAEESGCVVAILHVPGTLAAAIEQRVAERVDGILSFGWREGGPVRRRVLFLPKMRGLPPALDADEVPIFEVGVRRGEGLTLSRVKTVL